MTPSNSLRAPTFREADVLHVLRLVVSKSNEPGVQSELVSEAGNFVAKYTPETEQGKSEAVDVEQRTGRLLARFAELLRKGAMAKSPESVVPTMAEALDLLYLMLPSGSSERQAAMVANHALDLACALRRGDLTPKQVDSRMAKSLDALNGKPEARTNVNGQRLVALRSILQWFEYPKLKAKWKPADMQPQDAWLASEDYELPPHAAKWLASEVYERLHELYPDDFPNDGDPDPWSRGVGAAEALIPVWNKPSGYLRELNSFLTVWGLAVADGTDPLGAHESLGLGKLLSKVRKLPPF